MTAVAAVVGLAAPDWARAQNWSMPFQHNQTHFYTHPYLPWGAPAGAIAGGTPITPIAGMMIHAGLGWPAPAFPSGPSFNATHMALISKGPYRGHVLVMQSSLPTLIQNPVWAPTQSGNIHQSFQAYAIIDPADSPTDGIRFRNFLLPLGDLDPAAQPGRRDFFCSGHT